MAFPGFKRLARGLARTRASLQATFLSLGGGREIDEDTIDDLETALLSADLGPSLTAEVIEQVRKVSRSGRENDGLKETLRRTLREALPDLPAIPALGPEAIHVTFVVGVNGGGKTTTIGKLAARERAEGRTVLVVAADTFRAAAIDQLERWAERAGVELARGAQGADPAAVVFDALRSARARGIRRVLVDTAGRLHTKSNLMAELAKLARVAAREVEGAPHEVLLVIDATTGQNGLAQADEFTRAAALTGVVLTKLDGTAKGGVALGIHRRLGVPIRFVGVGEGIEDLLEFDPDAFLDGLLGDETRPARSPA